MTRSRRSPGLWAFATLAAFAPFGPALRAQVDDALLTLTGFDGALYLSVAAVGDTNGDGLTEILVGDPSFIVSGTCQVGRYSLHSGSEGALLAEAVGTQCSLEVGYAVCDAGDQDGDGIPDYLVAASPNSVSSRMSG